MDARLTPRRKRAIASQLLNPLLIGLFVAGCVGSASTATNGSATRPTSTPAAAPKLSGFGGGIAELEARYPERGHVEFFRRRGDRGLATYFVLYTRYIDRVDAIAKARLLLPADAIQLSDIFRRTCETLTYKSKTLDSAHIPHLHFVGVQLWADDRQPPGRYKPSRINAIEFFPFRPWRCG